MALHPPPRLVYLLSQLDPLQAHNARPPRGHVRRDTVEQGHHLLRLRERGRGEHDNIARKEGGVKVRVGGRRQVAGGSSPCQAPQRGLTEPGGDEHRDVSNMLASSRGRGCLGMKGHISGAAMGQAMEQELTTVGHTIVPNKRAR